jgi:dipeptidyl aminopeptidase/acylaminoacyl peptidase
MDNFEILKSIKQITDVRRIELKDEFKGLIGPVFTKIAEENSQKIYAYRIEYKTKCGKCIGYIVEPREGDNLPVVIWNRGGNRDFGMIKHEMLFTNYSLIAPLALNGNIVIATQYPGVEGGEGLDKMGSDEDLASITDLYEIIKQYKRADKSKVGMYGHSRGGLMTYMLLARVKWIKCAVIGAGPTNEFDVSRKDWEKTQKELWGGSKLENKKRSAQYWPEKISRKTPILIMHGTADWRVDPLDSLKMSIKLYENKVPHRLIMYEGADHIFAEVRAQYNKQAINWFERFLKNNEDIPNLEPHGK